MKHITITPKDLDGYKILFTDSGHVIDELAYSIGQCTHDELYDYAEGEPYKPYSFDYEGDLFRATKTESKLYATAKTLGIGLNANLGKLSKKKKLQAGAFMALQDPTSWAALLEAYTNKLQDDRTDAMSNAYVKALEEEVESYYKDITREWLHGDHSNSFGVIYEIGKYYTENPRECSYDLKTDEYTFALDEDVIEFELEAYDGSKYSLVAYKNYLLMTIRNKSEARQYKDKQEHEKRKKEREDLAAYKEGREKMEAEDRRAKLLAMKLK